MNDEVQNDLDAEYRHILYMIKPYIGDINDHYRLEKYRVWLEKLSAASGAEKLERNKYLVELANQIHDNVLRPPFTFNPPRGPLPKLQRVEESIYAPEEPEDWVYVPARRQARTDQPVVARRSRSNDPSPQVTRKVRTKTVNRPFQTIGKLNDDNSIKASETSSWCDLSGSTTSEPGCGDATEDEGKNKEAEKPLSASHEERRQELEALKTRMKDLLEVKNALKDTHVLSEDRKKNFDNLQKKVKVLEKENGELKALLESQRKKFIEMDKQKTKELNEFKEKILQHRQQELDQLKERHQEQIKKMEKSQSSTISVVESEYESKIAAVKTEYEGKIKQLTESNNQLLKEMETEIRRLRDELKCRGDAPVNDQDNEQIITLKKCLSKLDRTLHKNEKDYIKKIEKLKQELDMREMTAKMQLQTQRADLIVRNTVSKQEEMKTVLDSLEGKYKKMMESLQLHAMEAKKNDEKLIQELKSILEKHNIAF